MSKINVLSHTYVCVCVSLVDTTLPEVLLNSLAPFSALCTGLIPQFLISQIFNTVNTKFSVGAARKSDVPAGFTRMRSNRRLVKTSPLQIMPCDFPQKVKVDYFFRIYGVRVLHTNQDNCKVPDITWLFGDFTQTMLTVAPPRGLFSERLCVLPPRGAAAEQLHSGAFLRPREFLPPPPGRSCSASTCENARLYPAKPLFGESGVWRVPMPGDAGFVSLESISPHRPVPLVVWC